MWHNMYLFTRKKRIKPVQLIAEEIRCLKCDGELLSDEQLAEFPICGPCETEPEPEPEPEPELELESEPLLLTQKEALKIVINEHEEGSPRSNYHTKSATCDICDYPGYTFSFRTGDPNVRSREYIRVTCKTCGATNSIRTHRWQKEINHLANELVQKRAEEHSAWEAKHQKKKASATGIQQ